MMNLSFLLYNEFRVLLVHVARVFKDSEFTSRDVYKAMVNTVSSYLYLIKTKLSNEFSRYVNIKLTSNDLRRCHQTFNELNLSRSESYT